MVEVGDILTTTWRTASRNFVPFALIAGAVMIPLSLLGFVLTVALHYALPAIVESADHGSLGPAAVLGALVWCITIFLSIAAHAFVQGALMYGAVEALAGRRPTIGAMASAAIKQLHWLIIASLLVSIAVVVGFLCCFVPGPLALCLLCLVIPAIVVEQMGPIQAVQRSFELTQPHLFNVFLVWLVIIAAVLTMSCCIFGPVVGGMGALGAGGDPAAIAELQNPLHPVQLFTQLLSMGLRIVIDVTVCTVTAVLYAKIRGVRDGVDAEALARVFA